MTGASAARPGLELVSDMDYSWHWAAKPTLRAFASPIDRGTRDQYIVHHREDALAADPRSVLMPDRAVVQYGGFVQPHTAAVDAAREWKFLGMEVVPAGAIEHLVWLVAQHRTDAFGGIADRGVDREI